MRVRVKDILDMLAAGASRDEILADYPYLEDADITAALNYAAAQTDHTKDEDFVTLLSTRPNGATVVWVRIGNTTRRTLLEWFEKVLPRIESALHSGCHRQPLVAG
jgi:predicted nuclease of predicted toxin-antitoxin system